ncbi:Pentatricopeptide repeat-containing protein [Forsythia ovata]|uniref:Pentatricopeptide repeat-containing protein n=1 Tax=Forsythia ovata TaxID=205694 RepID=A0ABD1QMZ9_9LAMI
MAARCLFLTLTRNARREDKSSFRFLFSTSQVAHQIQEPSSTIHDEHVDYNIEEGQKDDLKSRIFRLRLPKRSATNILQKWIGEGHKITISDLRSISRDLTKSHRYKHALEISEWMISRDEYELSDSDYAVRIDLMTKVFGIDAAERYFEGLPPVAKTSETYTALLHSYARLKLIEKAEELYKRIKEANLSLSAITYNELMTLYMSVGQLEKVGLIVEEIRRENISPDLFTYNLWVSSCAATLNIDEVRRILGEMSRDSGCNESWVRYLKLAHIYITSSHLVHSESDSLVESKKDITQREMITYDFLVILYGALNNKEKLDQIWRSLRMTRQKLTGRNYVCILSSYLMVEDLKEVGEILDQWKQSATSEFDSSICHRLLKAFKDAGLDEKATSFHMLLSEKGCDLTDEK